MFWTSSGRQALWLILRSLELSPGAGVAVPLYADGSVAPAVRAAGYQPVFVDIEEQTLTLDPASVARKRSQLSAIVVLHFFGHVARIDQLLEVAGLIPLIEDTAHAPLSFFAGQMVGTFGVACFYSFASTKYWPAGGGGLAAVNDPALAEKVAAEARRLTAPSFIDEFCNPFVQASKAMVFRRPIYGLVGRSTRPRAERYELLEPSLSSEAIGRGSAAAAIRQVATFARLVERQRANSLQLLDRLRGVEGIVLPWERSGVSYNYHLFPVLLADEEEKKAVMAGMLERHVDTSQNYFDAVPLARRLGYRGGCPVSERVASRMLTLPNYAANSSADVDRVASVFLESLKSHRRLQCRKQPQPAAAVPRGAAP